MKRKIRSEAKQVNSPDCKGAIHQTRSCSKTGLVSKRGSVGINLATGDLQRSAFGRFGEFY